MCSAVNFRFGFRVRLLVALALVFVAAVSHAAAQAISPEAAKQIAAAVAFKESLSPSEQKLSTSLALAARAAAHEPLGPLARFVPLPPRGGWQVEVKGHMSPSLLTSSAMSGIEKVNGVIPSHVFTDNTALVRVTAPQLLALAAHGDVQAISERRPVRFLTGKVTSQGVVAHRAREVLQTGITGAGVTVGVLSDSASPASLQALIASGDLPADTLVVPGEDGTDIPGYIDEGSAMMEIVHDMAPGAKLVFATSGLDEGTLADHVRTLRFNYHCDIIVDDVAIFGAPVFQDDQAAIAINDVTTDGAVYVTAGGNFGNLTFGTSGTYEADFRDSGMTIAGERLHNFGTVGHPQTYDAELAGGGNAIALYWSDSFNATQNDYDLFVLDATGTSLKAFSVNRQNGGPSAIEVVTSDPSCYGPNPTGYCAEAGDRILIGLYHGQTRALHLRTEQGYPTLSIATAGALFGHNAAASAITVNATAWNSAGGGPAAFSGFANQIEFFDSDGPRRIFYHADGTPITPGKYTFASSGGTTLVKPDLVGADGVTTRTLRPFYGDSAAAPHVAAIAALVKSANPKLTNAQIRMILSSTTLDTMAPGVDRDSGYGIAMADGAVKAALAMQ